MLASVNATLTTSNLHVIKCVYWKCLVERGF